MGRPTRHKPEPARLIVFNRPIKIQSLQLKGQLFTKSEVSFLADNGGEAEIIATICGPIGQNSSHQSLLYASFLTCDFCDSVFSLCLVNRADIRASRVALLSCPTVCSLLLLLL